ncbi:hypothetical protein C8Q80DRAFT_819215 [Daedaleopsis nitida]|nr:hypothetical protein C8Q80DRAFT_819215 [Daedaleopsis nitida]
MGTRALLHSTPPVSGISTHSVDSSGLTVSLLPPRGNMAKKKKLNYLTCPLCIKSFPASWQCRQHIRDVHPAPKPKNPKTFECYQCKERFDTKSSWKHHTQALGHQRRLPPGVTLPHEAVQCYECKQVFKNESACQDHARTREHRWNEELSSLDLPVGDMILLSSLRAAKTFRLRHKIARTKAAKAKAAKSKRSPPESTRQEAPRATMSDHSVICVRCWHECRNLVEYHEVGTPSENHLT